MSAPHVIHEVELLDSFGIAWEMISAMSAPLWR
jgi:hypothetical protein